MKIFVVVMAFLNLIIAGSSKAIAEGIATAVVKVRSYPCGDLSRMKFGSGTAIGMTVADVKILTSSHIIYHGIKNQGICHEILGPEQKWFPAELEKVNGGVGLALLKPSLDFDKVFNFRAELSNQPVIDANSEVTVAGYPLKSETLVGQTGTVLIANSHRVVLPLVDEAIEVEGAHNEYGMSGGGVFDPKTKKYVGLLSHQYLKITPGQEARAGTVSPEIEADHQAKLIALVIGVDVIQKWLHEIAQGQGQLAEDLDSQLKNTLAITIGSIRFKQVGCGPGLGGIGGEGVGVGGEGDDSPIDGVDSSRCKIQLERVSPELSNDQSWPLEKTQNWFDRQNDRLKFGETLVFSDLFLRERKSGVRGLYHALTRMKEGFIPLVTSEEQGGDYEVSPEMKRRVEILRASLLKLREVSENANAPAEARRVVEYLETVALAIETGNFSAVDTKYTRKAIYVGAGGNFVEGWVYLFNENMEEAVNVTKTVTWLCDAVDKI